MLPTPRSVPPVNRNDDVEWCPASRGSRPARAAGRAEPWPEIRRGVGARRHRNAGAARRAWPSAVESLRAGKVMTSACSRWSEPPKTAMRQLERRQTRSCAGTAAGGTQMDVSRRQRRHASERSSVGMATENPRWGYMRIQGALKNLDHRISRSDDLAHPARRGHPAVGNAP